MTNVCLKLVSNSSCRKYSRNPRDKIS